MDYQAIEQEFDRAIGEVIRAAAQLERTLGHAYAELIQSPFGMDTSAGLLVEPLLQGIERFAYLANTTRVIVGAPIRPVSDQHLDRIKRLVKKSRDLMDQRNQVVHGHWGAITEIEGGHSAATQLIRKRAWIETDWTVDGLRDLAAKLWRVEQAFAFLLAEMRGFDRGSLDERSLAYLLIEDL